MKTAARLLLLPVLTLLSFAVNARGQVTSTAYSNLTTDGNINLPLGGASDGGSTALTADDLTYDAGSGGQNLSAFKVIIYNNNDNGSTESVTPTVVFWDSDGSAGGPGTLLGTYTLPLVTVAEQTGQTLTFAVPAAEQFALPVAIGASPTHTIWAGIYVTGTSGESAVVLDAFGSELFNPPTVGSSQDQYFSSNATGSAAAVSNPAGGVFSQPFGAVAVANFGWELTTVTPGTLDVLDNFPASAFSFAGPEGALLLAADGNYYGTTGRDGAAGDGTIFQLTPAGTINTIFEFSGANGAKSRGALIQGNDGLLYGTTSAGGENGNGTIFSIPTGSTTQALKVLHSFAPGESGDPNADGSFPSGALIQARDGNFYGVAQGGGAAGDGTVFRITPAGAFTLLASFGSDATAPSNPAGALIEDADGNLVGITQLGGANGNGAIFQLTLAGNLTTLDSLTAANQEPFGQLVLGGDGNFHGVSLFGGAGGDATVFLVTPGVDGALTTLASLGKDSREMLATGPLIMASDGIFYGVADDPGLSIYGVTPGLGGTLDFEQILDGSVGADPTPLIQGSDGNFYGATGGGGTGSNGTIYRLTTALPPVVQFSQSEYAVNEFAGTATIRVDRIGGTDAISVNYVTEDGAPSPFPDDGNATAGTDYQSTAGTLHWAAGDQTPKFFTVQIIDDGATDGGLLTLTMQLNSPEGSAGLGFPNTATLTINDSVLYAPAITTAKTASAKQGVAFSYQIAATNHPASYTVSGLTDGFSLNPTTGMIIATPTNPGMLDLTLHATNAIGTGSAPLTITIAGSAPVVTSATTANGTVGATFFYQIVATNLPTSFGFQGNANGLTINTTTGVISGTPKASGTFGYTLNAYNGTGKGSATLTVTIKAAAPVITSATTVTGKVGTAFSYRIAATNGPTNYGASDLPAGLTINETTGAISGTPTTAGTTNVSLYATGAGGTGMATLKVTIAASAPVITSAATATATTGKAFSYQITATNSPTQFGVQGLPAGFTANSSTGVISGTPKAAGKVTLTLNAYNSTGKGSAPLTLTILGPPVITSATTATATQGETFSYQITANNSPMSFGVQGLPAGLSINTASGLISGSVSGAGKVTLTLNAYNSVGKGSATLTLTVTAAPPVITSAATATAMVGKAFSYQITASNQPTEFGVQGLPAGFSVNTNTGLLTGTPKGAGKVSLTLNAYNSVGKGSAALTLTINAAP